MLEYVYILRYIKILILLGPDDIETFTYSFMNWNHRLFFKINGLAGKNKFLDKISVFGGRWLVYLIFILPIIYIVYSSWTIKLADYFFVIVLYLIYFSLLWFMIWLVSLLIGRLIKEKRPFITYTSKINLLYKPLFEKWKSFPSDHSMTVFLVFFIMAFNVGVWSLVLLPFCLLVGWGRIYGGVHYPADIIGGMVLAFIGYLVFGVLLFNKLISLIPTPNL